MEVKTVDNDGLDDFFDIDSTFNDNETTTAVTRPPICNNSLATRKIDCDSVYEQLGEIVQTCGSLINDIAELININDNIDTELFGALTGLINSQKDMLKEFTGIHMEKIRHNHRLELAEANHSLKMKELHEKARLKNIANSIEQPSGLTYSHDAMLDELDAENDED